MFTFQQFLYSEVKPALGCTEPAAVALAVARAQKELDQPVESIELELSESVYKNGKYVGIPRTNGERGNNLAAALGALCGDPEAALEVLTDVTPEVLEKAKGWLQTGRVTARCLDGVAGVFIRAIVRGKNAESCVIIQKNHTNITKIEKNGAVIFEKALEESVELDVFGVMNTLCFHDLFVFLEQITPADEAYLLKGYQMNMQVAKEGIKGKNSGLQVGLSLKRMIENGMIADDPVNSVRLLTSAASDARMSGVNLPVMSSAGSGNHGLVAIIPVGYMAGIKNKSDQELARALAVSHLVTSFVKSRTGRLTPICGCTVAAGAGAAAGIAYLRGDEIVQIERAVQTVLANIIGMICDGAKESCAFKVGTGAAEALLAANMAHLGWGIDHYQGVVGADIDQTINNLIEISATGMEGMDQIILNILQRQRDTC